MIEKCIFRLDEAIHFGIPENEEIHPLEKAKRMTKFRSELSYEKYSDLFIDVEELLISNITNEEKSILFKYLVEFINCYSVIEENEEKFPHNISVIYKSYKEFMGFNVLLDDIYYCDITMIHQYLDLVKDFLLFIDFEKNAQFVNLYKDILIEFNKSLIDYLEKTDFNGIKHKDNIGEEKIFAALNKSLEKLSNNEKTRM